jgi:hypothetical protein
MPTLPFTSKRRSFGPFLILVFFFFFFFFFKKKKKKKKKKGRPKMGWSGHPIFGQGVASATPKGHQEKKKKKTKWVCAVGGGRTTPKALGGGPATPYDHTQALGGGPATPNGTNPFLFFFFFFFSWWPFGVAGPPPKAWGWLRPPHTGRMGWPKPPPISLFFFFFFFFLKKKTKIINGPKLRRFGRAQNGVVLE